MSFLLEIDFILDQISSFLASQFYRRAESASVLVFPRPVNKVCFL